MGAADASCRPTTRDWHAPRLASIGLPFHVTGPAELIARLRTTAALSPAALFPAAPEAGSEGVG